MNELCNLLLNLNALKHISLFLIIDL